MQSFQVKRGSSQIFWGCDAKCVGKMTNGIEERYDVMECGAGFWIMMGMGYRTDRATVGESDGIRAGG